MPVNNGVVSKPFSPADIYKLFGVSKRPDGYNVGYIVGDKEGKINMFSKHKPVQYDSPTATYENTPDLYKAFDGNCGIEFPTTNSILNVSKSNWTYRNVSGNAWKRLADFNKYDHTAAPFLQYGVNDINVDVYSLPSKFVIRGTIVESSDSNLGYTDFSGGVLGGTWLTSCIKKGSIFMVKSAPVKIFESEAGLSIEWSWTEFGTNPPAAGIYEIYMVLSKQQYPTAVGLEDIVNNSIIPVWHDTKYRNPFHLNVTSVPPLTFRIKQMGTRYYDVRDTSYYELDPDKLYYDDYGNPHYTGTNALRTNGECYIVLELTNGKSSPAQFNAGDIYMRADNFRMGMSQRMAVRLYTDTALNNIVNGYYQVEANQKALLYMSREIFNVDNKGGSFVPNYGDTIAPANVTLYQGFTGGALTSAVGLVVVAP